MDTIFVVFFGGAGIYILFDAQKKLRYIRGESNEEKVQNKLKVQFVCGYGLIVTFICLLIIETLIK